MGIHDNFDRQVVPSIAHSLLCIALLCAIAALLVSARVQADTVQTSIYISVCGNGIVDLTEVCDGGTGNNNGGYGSTASARECASDCLSFGPYCGDDVLQVRFNEQCDEGSSNSASGLCSPLCVSQPAVPPGAPRVVLGSVPTLSAPPGTILSVIKTQVVLRGKAFPNSDVNILLDGKPKAIVRADSNADFLFNTTDVSPGTATFSFWAKDSGGIESLTTSIVFDVVQSAVTSVNNVFLPPTLSVSDRQIKPGGLLTISGESVPIAKVTTTLDKETSKALTSTVDSSGKWALQLDTHSVAAGFHSVKASFTLSTTSKSGFGKSVNFFVGTQLPKGGVSPDINKDGKVNLVDFSIFLLGWGSREERDDFNQDGAVNLADFSIMLFNWTG